MKRRALEKMRDLLREDAARDDGVKFDLNTWARPSNGIFLEEDEPSMGCGTTACAVGLAALSGRFRGLSLIRGRFGVGLVPLLKVKGHELSTGWSAVERLFGIDEPTTNWVFDQAFYGPQHKTRAKGELEVAARIDDLLETDGDLESVIAGALERRSVTKAFVKEWRDS